MVPVHCGKKFSWNGTRGATEASTLGPSFVGHPLVDHRVEAFKVRSHKTGRELLFTRRRVLTNEGEVTGWEFSTQGVRPIIVTVFND